MAKKKKEKSLDDWLDEHDPDDSGVYRFNPNELSFNIYPGSGDVCDGPCVIITPTRYFKETGAQFDQEMEIPGLNLEYLCEGTFGVDANTRQHLLNLGLTEDTSMVWG